MTAKTILAVFIAFTIGFATSPSYGSDIISCDSFESCPDGSAPSTNAILALEARIAVLEELLTNVTRGTDPNTSRDTLTFTNMNVQVVSGSGSTDGVTNGTGNVIIGYNEKRLESANTRIGSHMLVLGALNQYSSFGGAVIGFNNTTNGIYSSVIGGRDNLALGSGSVVSGGRSNNAKGSFVSVSGGRSNIAEGLYASVSGGESNVAKGGNSSVSGGQNNTAEGSNSSVSGGRNGIASGLYSSVSGGHTNIANQSYSTVSGGYTNTASGWGSSVSGGQNKTAGANSCWTAGGVANC